MNDARRCHECGELNLPDAEFCASCGVALATAQSRQPGLAALLGDTAHDDGHDAPGDDPTGAVPPPVPPAGMTYEPGTGAATTAMPTGATDPYRAATGMPVSPARPPERAWLVPTVVVFAVLAAAVVVLLVVAVGSEGGSTDPDPTVPVSSAPEPTDPPTSTATTTPSDTTAPTTAAPTTAAPTTTDTPTTTAAPTTTTVTDPSADLAAIAAGDLPRLRSLQGRWMPQLSAKEDGTVWEGVAYDLDAIADLHRSLDTRVGGALLAEGSSLAFLRDGERMAGWWFTLADVDFGSADDALAWCLDAGFDRQNCGARLVTDDDDATGTLRLQPT